MFLHRTLPAPSLLRALKSSALLASLADFFAVLTATALPWSTSLTIIFGLCWLGAAALTLDYSLYFRLLARPASYLPFAFFGLVVAGSFWSIAPLDDRMRIIGTTVKLLMIPGLFCYFTNSTRGHWVLGGFLVSCVAVLAASFIAAFYPGFTLRRIWECGIPVRNSIDQAQEFALCAAALIMPMIALGRQRSWFLFSTTTALFICFILNLAFVVSSRSALITLATLLIISWFWCFSINRAFLLSLFTVVAVTGMAHGPRLCPTFNTTSEIYRYSEGDGETSTGLRLEFWKKSLRSFEEAPLLGHGTGSIRTLFEKAAKGKSGVEAVVTSNPHNQTLNVAVQWGVIGVVVLYSLWAAHLFFFRGGDWTALLGTLIVAQNVVGSFFNSHLFDFHEGWLYVFGVGLLGGLHLRLSEVELEKR